MATTLLEQVAVDDLGADQFVSRFNPGRLGNTMNIAYGGCTIGVAIQAASQTAPSNFFLYSATGNYLGPALTDRKVKCAVRRVRSTRTFATRLVELSQEQDDGSTRLCVILMADFHLKEAASLLVYSAPPEKSYTPVEKCPTMLEKMEEMVQAGIVSRSKADAFAITFGLMNRFIETRGTPEGVLSNNLNGLAKNVRVAQHDASLTSKTSADWVRCRHPLQSHHYAGASFVMDGALSFLPLAHNNMFLDDAGACSSLDFALRFFTSDLDFNSWHLKELKTITGGDGRTYSEGRLWDQEGNMVANMTQQSILRPLKPTKKAVL